MKTVGIIAEYNPFHNGHAYQIEEARKKTGAKYVVVIMSGNFVQRGTPAWTDKYLRAQMALDNGADIVLELPTVYATASAETFAYGGVSLLHQLGCIDYLCFGSECGALKPLVSAANFLVSPPDAFNNSVREAVCQGKSYPVARQEAFLQFYFEQNKVSDLFTDVSEIDCTSTTPETVHTLFQSPNNILGIEYIKALLQLNSPILPVTIPRKDNGYHTQTAAGTFLSASGIRTQTRQTGKIPHTFLPENVVQLLQNNPQRFPMDEDDFSSILYYRLWTASCEELASFADVSVPLAERIKNKLPSFTNIRDFTTLVKTKQYTYSRISRALLHCMLSIPSTPVIPPVQYAVLLGFRKDASHLLRKVSTLPIITKKADAASQWEQQHTSISLAKAHWDIDLLADALYRQCLYRKHGYLLPDTYHAPILRR